MIQRIGAGLAMAAACLAFALGAASAEAALTLKAQPAIAKGVEAFPRVSKPDRTGKIINTALDRADARLRTARADCVVNPGGKDEQVAYWWERSVSAPMRGPAFISLSAVDAFNCGGPHPNEGTLRLTYDLASGRPITWSKYLPASLVSPETLSNAADGTVIGVVEAPALMAIYRRKALVGVAVNDDCRTVIEGVERLALWIDAKQSGLAMEPTELSHAEVACGDPVVITAAELRKLGASPKLIDAIDTAHRAHSWTDKF